MVAINSSVEKQRTNNHAIQNFQEVLLKNFDPNPKLIAKRMLDVIALIEKMRDLNECERNRKVIKNYEFHTKNLTANDKQKVYNILRENARFRSAMEQYNSEALLDVRDENCNGSNEDDRKEQIAEANKVAERMFVNIDGGLSNVIFAPNKKDFPRKDYCKHIDFLIGFKYGASTKGLTKFQKARVDELLAKNSFYRYAQKTVNNPSPLEVKDTDCNGFISYDEMRAHAQPATDIAKEIVSDAIKNKSDVIMLGETHSLKTGLITIEVLREMQRQYPFSKIAFGLESDPLISPLTLKFISELKTKNFEAITPEQKQKLILELTTIRGKESLVVMTMEDGTSRKLTDEEREVWGKVTEARISRFDPKDYGTNSEFAEAQNIVEAIALGFDVFFFDTYEGEENEGEEKFGATYDLREGHMASTIKEISKTHKVVVQIGALHAAQDAQKIHQFIIEYDAEILGFKPKQSDNFQNTYDLLKASHLNVLGIYAARTLSPNEELNASSKEKMQTQKYYQYDRVYSTSDY